MKTKTLKFKTGNDLPFVSTHLQGYINISYQEIVDKLGKPHGGDGYKTDAEWDIDFGKNQRATIYNYKDGKNYNGSKGIPTSRILDWHIGGNNSKVVKLVGILFDKPTQSI